ncbi:N-acetyltransferase [Microvirga sp. STR05]|uniref:N-acetyltransferase n=1 Tax=Hymenobacter duratus TaxID=2771356 RepID=A0ABR8JHZ9_9BACT|nr:GNAT family N-acetyltransferase [Hymenobacter duratus]MBD2715361.1 N-acetyltransferase [Hymenobacter duratus]MBR7950268.1 N-acetyltransferase [Microvirga sp. STR05]
MPVTIQHQPQDQEFTATLDGHSGELAYSFPTEDVIDFTHTFVDKALRGKGVGEALAKEALAYAQQQNLKIRTSCEFMKSYVAQHPEYQPLLDRQQE